MYPPEAKRTFGASVASVMASYIRRLRRSSLRAPMFASLFAFHAADGWSKVLGRYRPNEVEVFFILQI